MKPARILLLVVAVIAGGLAAFLATRGQPPAPVQTAQTEIIQEARIQVLVASTSIGVGERLGENVVMWQDWPENAIRPEYITAEVLPDAPQQMTGTVARFEIFAGEPIRASKLIRTEQGYLSAVINQGMRAVSIAVTAASGAGGFIVPNDRVDVVQTTDEGNGPVSATILANVKVLAIGKRLGQVGQSGGAVEGEDDPNIETFSDKTIATLELDPYQSESIIAASTLGPLTLVLRSVVDFNAATEERRNGANQAITLIRYGTQTSVQSNTTAQMTVAGESAADLAAATMESVVQPLFTQAGLSTNESAEESAAPVPARQ